MFQIHKMDKQLPAEEIEESKILFNAVKGADLLGTTLVESVFKVHVFEVFKVHAFGLPLADNL